MEPLGKKFAALKQAAMERLLVLVARPRTMSGLLLLVIVAAVHAAVWLVPSVFEPLHAQSIDRLFRLRAEFAGLRPTYDGTVYLVPIDDDSVQRREGFYLGRGDYGQLVENLAEAGAPAQFLDVIFAAPEPGEGDARLAQALDEAPGVYVGMAVGASADSGDRAFTPPSASEAAVLARSRWTEVERHGNLRGLLEATQFFMTFPGLARSADGIGHIDLSPDRDGVIRRVPLVVRDGDELLPSLHLLLLTDYLGVDPAQIDLRPGRLTLNGAKRPEWDAPRRIRIPLNRRGEMTVNFVGAFGSFQTYPFSSIYTASDDRFTMMDLRDELTGRIPVITWFSTGRGDLGPVPTDPLYPRAGVWANAMNTILTGEFLYELSGWQMLFFVEIPLLALLAFTAVRFSTIPYVLTAVGLFLAYLVVVAAAFLGVNLVLNVPAPLIVLIASTPVVAAYQFHLEAEKRAKVHRELAVAREIQMGTLPSKLPPLAGYDLAGRSVPADETGGDSFDVIPCGKQKLTLLLGDATGHGIGPALSVTQVRSMLRVAMRLGAGLDEAVTHINDQLDDDLAANRFVTAFLGRLDGTTHEVEFHAAGQGPLLHYHAARDECEWFGSSMLALGVFGGLPVKTAQSRTLEPGDLLGLMTDGVFEQENASGEQYGEDRVEALVRAHRDRPMQELLERIFTEVEAHRGEVAQSDDVTVLLVRRTE